MRALINKQRKFFATGESKTVAFRIEQLKKLKKWISDNEVEIMRALHLDLGKPELEAYSTEVAYLKSELKLMIAKIKCWSRPEKVSTPFVTQPASSEIRHEPYGVCLVLAPWNYPFQLLVSPLIGAIAAGNCVVVKASEMTPHTQNLIHKMITDLFPQDYIASVIGGIEASQSLLNEQFDFIFFTGGTEIGRVVMSAAAKYLTPVCLELGGKSPCIVDTEIDMKVAARRIIWGKFINAGQTCVAPDYVYVNQHIRKEFAAHLISTVKEFYGDDPKQSTSYARIVNERHLQRLTGLLENQKILIGGQFDISKKYFAPTILDDVRWDASVMQDEIFGPVLPILYYDNIETVFKEVSSRAKPLALYVFSKNKSFQNSVLDRLSFGGACVNDCILHLANKDLPFGGVGESGMGAYHGKASFDLFSHKKSIMKKQFVLDTTMRYAPYTDIKMKLIRFFLD